VKKPKYIKPKVMSTKVKTVFFYRSSSSWSIDTEYDLLATLESGT
jgi:hypothetical protein